MNEFQGDDAEHEKKFTELECDCNKRIAYLDWPGGYQYTEWINPRQTTARLISSTIRHNTRAISQAFQTISVLLMTRHFSHDIIKQIKQNKQKYLHLEYCVYICRSAVINRISAQFCIYKCFSHQEHMISCDLQRFLFESGVAHSFQRSPGYRPLKSPINFSSRLRNYINIFFFTNILQKNVSALII